MTGEPKQYRTRLKTAVGCLTEAKGGVDAGILRIWPQAREHLVHWRTTEGTEDVPDAICPAQWLGDKCAKGFTDGLWDHPLDLIASGTASKDADGLAQDLVVGGRRVPRHTQEPADGRGDEEVGIGRELEDTGAEV